jgi:carbon monoxide dehydrogenase subunit G
LELMHDFRVDVPIDQAWEVLTDLERIAPCMPGAQLLEVEGDEYRGIVKVKVGPITAQYRGTARFTELDPTAHKAVVRAEGRDTRGQGTAAATVVATLDGGDAGTAVHIETDLDISGKVAQFGRGMLAEVSEKLLGQFVQQLESNVLAGPTGNGAAAEAGSRTGGAGDGAATVETTGEAEATGEAATGEAPPRVRAIDSPEAEPVDIMQAAGGSVAKRAAPIIVGLIALLIVLRLRRRRRSRRARRAD